MCRAVESKIEVVRQDRNENQARSQKFLMEGFLEEVWMMCASPTFMRV